LEVPLFVNSKRSFVHEWTRRQWEPDVRHRFENQRSQ
jgi:hypothetical protein